MKLQSDPTIIYGITRGYPLGRGIRQSEIDARHALQHLCDRRPAAGADLQSRQGFARGGAQSGTDATISISSPTEPGGHVFSATVAEPGQERRHLARSSNDDSNAAASLTNAEAAASPQMTSKRRLAVNRAPSESPMTFVSMTGFAEAHGSHEGAALALGSEERQRPQPRSAPAHAAGLRRRSKRPARRAGGRTLQARQLPGHADLSKRRKARAG